MAFGTSVFLHSNASFTKRKEDKIRTEIYDIEPGLKLTLPRMPMKANLALKPELSICSYAKLTKDIEPKGMTGLYSLSIKEELDRSKRKRG